MEKLKKSRPHVLNIDLGTVTSQMTVLEPSGIIRVLPDINGDTTILSIVSVANDKPVVGRFAKQDKFFNPEMVAEQFKKLMDQVNNDGTQIIRLISPDGTQYTPTTLSAEVLRHLKVSAEKIEGHEFDKAIIGAPAYFKDRARQATKDAGLIAGFKEVYIENEPVSAATLYGITKGQDLIIAVFDFGGGTFDICILEVKNGKVTVLSIDGDPECGGSNIDEIIFLHVREFLKTKGKELNPEKDAAEWLEIIDACKQAKEELAIKEKTLIPLRIENERTSMELTRQQLNEYCSEIIKNLKNCCQRAIKKTTLNTKDIDKVLKVGGSSRLKIVDDVIKEVFGKEPESDTDPDLAVVKGNAIIGAAHFSNSAEEIMVEGKKYLASSLKPQEIVARDLCVAAVTKKDKDGINLYNVPIIPVGSKLPFETIEHFTPIDHRCSVVAVKLIDGAPGELSSNFTPLEEAEVRVQPTDAANNDDRIEFKITMDTEALVNITVRDTLLNKPVPITLKFHAGLSNSDIDKMRSQLLARHK